MLAAVFLFYTVLVVAPFEIVAANADSLSIGIQDVGWVAVVLATGLSLVYALLASALRGRAFTAGLMTTYALGLGCYVQALFLNVGLPPADGAAVPWHYLSGTTLWTGLIWVAIIVAALVTSRLFDRPARLMAGLLAAALLVVQGVGVGSLLLDPATLLGTKPAPIDCTVDGLHELSPKDNVVVFVLDTYDTAYLRDACEEEPALLASFEDFTFFENSTGSMIPTRYGVPFLLTGSLPQQGETFEDWYYDLYERGSFLDRLSDAGYSLGIYTDSIGSDFDTETKREVAGKTLNLHPSDRKTIDFWAAANMLARCALYRDAPWALKPSFWFYTDELNNNMTSATDLYQMNDARYYRTLREEGIALTDEGEAGAFRFIHLTGAHYPFTMNEYGEDVGEDNTSPLQQYVGSMKIVGEYLEQMKALGVYDEATIVVTADHGLWYCTLDDIHEPTSPIMLVKPSRESGGARKPLQTTNAPVSHLDFQATVLADLGLDTGEYGKPIFEACQDAGRKRLYYMTASDGLHDFSIREMEVDGDVRFFSNWKYTGREWPIKQQ